MISISFAPIKTRLELASCHRNSKHSTYRVATQGVLLPELLEISPHAATCVDTLLGMVAFLILARPISAPFH